MQAIVCSYSRLVQCWVNAPLSLSLSLPLQARKHMAALSQWHPVQKMAKQPKTGCIEQLFFFSGSQGPMSPVCRNHIRQVTSTGWHAIFIAVITVQHPGCIWQDFHAKFLNSMPDKQPKSHAVECCFQNAVGKFGLKWIVRCPLSAKIWGIRRS